MQTFSPEIAHAKNYNRWILSLFQEHIHGNCLEIGVAHGNFIDLLPKTIRYVGLDIEPCYVEEVQKRGVEAFVADISDSDLLAKVKEKWVECI
ncbi:MAG: hypothetical protein LBD15_03055, partial [Holosporales bacterium]|nr:hypothetical protein [Holosporales bacterium]